MKFNLNEIEDLIPLAMKESSIGDAWLDARQQELIPRIGHTHPYYRLFYMIAKKFRPQFSVELGSEWGTAAAHLASGNLDGVVLTVDIHREDKDAQKRTQEADRQYPNLHYINAWTWDAVPVVKSWERPIDILFIDAWHRYDYAIREWNIYTPLLADEALVICDDLRDAEGATIDMIKFWNEVKEGYENFFNVGLHSFIPMGFIKFVR